MEIDQALAVAEARFPECVALGYVELTTGAWVGLRAADPVARNFATRVAASAAELLRSPELGAAEVVFQRHRREGASPSAGIDEIVVTSQERLHLVIRAKKSRDHAMVLVCPAGADIGAWLAEARVAAAALEEAAMDRGEPERAP